MKDKETTETADEAIAPDAGASAQEAEAPAHEEVMVAEEAATDEPTTDGQLQDLEELQDRHLRLAADFENYRKRMLRERAEVLASANEDLVLDMLPVVDNLERAVSSVKNGGDEGMRSIVKGVELTLKMFQGILGRYGVERMQAVGEEFDPHRHDALMQEESAEVAADTVGEELEPGYTMHGRVVRPARVKVMRAKGPEAPVAAEGVGSEATEGTEAKEREAES